MISDMGIVGRKAHQVVNLRNKQTQILFMRNFNTLCKMRKVLKCFRGTTAAILKTELCIHPLSLQLYSMKAMNDVDPNIFCEPSLYSGSRSWMTPAAIYVVDITVHCNKVPT
jgi:hypothetical protein